MAERRWTDEQLSAIETRDKTLLVSAAAGSGKTATLTERIIRSLLDEKNPIDIDSLLVVTFTNAAAAELRSKISAALTAAVREHPDNKRLERQLYLLPSAKIRTIDSFCNEILRANCDRVGVPPNYRIADTAESELLAISIIEGLIEAAYNGELTEVATPEEFEELADCLTDSKRTEDLSEVLRFLHLRCESAERGIDLLKDLTEVYRDDTASVEDNPYGAFLLRRVGDMAKHYLAAYNRYERIFSSKDDGEKKYLGVIDSDKALLSAIGSIEEYDLMRERISRVAFARLPAVRDKSEDALGFITLRDMMKDDVTKLQGYFSYTTEGWRSLFSSLHRLMTVLYRFEKKFDTIFSEEKRRLGALSYADIERYTYNCLINDGEPTDIAINVSNGFSAIYIDEYQDVNAIQNRIFEAISRPDNRFMVGDIKQSIYGFRSARPEIFAEMKSSFPLLKGADEDCASIFMSRNFRCDKAVVDFVNNIFDKAFSFLSDSIGYSEGDRLGYAKIQEYGEPEYRYPEICMTTKTDSAISPDTVAAKISKLLKEGRLNNGEPIRPSDIAIILRNARGHDAEYATALERRGIPSCISGAKDFFLSSEVLLALCLLNSIDNPRRDIYLAGLMCSPLFDFTSDELYLIRTAGGESLCESLLSYVEANPEFAKGVSFINTLEHYRAISEGVSVDTLIHKLYRETGLMSLASRTGGKENLTLLYDYARGYEASSFKGLYNFINFINNIIDKRTTFDDARVNSGGDAVKIVTSHASKGLEYPVVFFVESDTKIYNKDRSSRIAFSEDFGISFRLRTPKGLAVVNNPVQDIINDYISEKLYEEEMRVLYVALTRARERLYVVGECPTIKREEYERKIAVIRDNLSEYSFRRLASYQEIVMVCDGSKVFDEETFAGIAAGDEPSVEAKISSSEEKVISPELTDTLSRRFNFKYSAPHLTNLPEKMSVSLMSPTVLDGTDAEAVLLTAEEKEEKKKILPAFASGADTDESAKRGIATHLFMQFCDLEYLRQQGATAERQRLLDGGFISKRDSERIRMKEIEMFSRSALFSEMLRARKLYRELRFNLTLPATSFTTEEEKLVAYRDREILVQGVIDCIIEREDGSLMLIDYKTDRLSNEEKRDRALAEKRLIDKHKMQLTLYATAIEKIFGRRPTSLQIYSLPLGDTIEIK